MDNELINCWACQTEMKYKIGPHESQWKKEGPIITIVNIKYQECPKCGEIIFSSQEVQIMQDLARSFRSEKDESI